MSPTKSDSHHARAERIANLTFEKLDAFNSVLNELTLDDCLATAQQEYLTLLSAAELLKKDDRELEATMRSEGSPEMWLELLDEITILQKRCRALGDVYDAIEARLLIILARLSETERP